MKGERMKNKNLAILLLATFLSMSIGTVAMAQDPVSSSAAAMSSPLVENGGNGAPQNDRMEKGGKNLDLTDSQKQQLKSLRDKRKAERAEQKSQFESSIRGILTPDQQAQFDRNKSTMTTGMKNAKAPGKTPPADMKPGTCTMSRGEGGQKGRGHRWSQALFTTITLTDSQKKQIDTIREGQKSKMLAMRTERDNEMKRILTPQQYQKFQEMKQNRGKHGGQNGCPRGGKGGDKPPHHGDSPSEKS
jgi:Spy/CpxP family protein refolding chaperone